MSKKDSFSTTQTFSFSRDDDDDRGGGGKSVDFGGSKFDLDDGFFQSMSGEITPFSFGDDDFGDGGFGWGLGDFF